MNNSNNFRINDCFKFKKMQAIKCNGYKQMSTNFSSRITHLLNSITPSDSFQIHCYSARIVISARLFSTSPQMSSSSSSSSECSPASLTNQWKPKTLAGRLVKRGVVKSLKDLRDRKLEIKEPEICDALFPDIQSEVIKVSNIGTGLYSRKAYIALGNGAGIVGMGKKCAGNDVEAISGAKKNGKVSVFEIEVRNGTLPHQVSGQFGQINITIQPWINNIIAPPMVRIILELAGFRSALVTGNCNSPNPAVIEAVFDALKKLRKMP